MIHPEMECASCNKKFCDKCREAEKMYETDDHDQTPVCKCGGYLRLTQEHIALNYGPSQLRYYTRRIRKKR